MSNSYIILPSVLVLNGKGQSIIKNKVKTKLKLSLKVFDHRSIIGYKKGFGDFC